MTDHIAYLKQFYEIGADIFLNQETYNAVSFRHHKSQFNVIDYKKSYNIGDFIVKPFPLVHNSFVNVDGSEFKETIPCDCTGYLILEKATKEKLIFITDTHYVNQQFPPVEYICIESNYFEKESYADELEFIQSKEVEKRRLFSHLSFENAMKFINHQDQSKLKEVRLLHLSSSLTARQKEMIKIKAKEEINKKDIEVIV